MQQELRELESYTNSRGLLPGLAHIHITENGSASAGDGDVELYIPKSSLPKGPWSANAAQLVAMARAAGDDATLSIDGENILITSKDFSGRVALAVNDGTVVSLQSQYVEKGSPEVMKIPHPHAFSEALRRCAPFASVDGAAGGHWTGVLIRGDKTLAASNQGFHITEAVFDGPFRKAGQPDIIIPARAALAAANAGAITSMEVNNEQGIGLFTLESGHIVLFRLLSGPMVDGKPGKYPDVDKALTEQMPPDEVFAAVGDLQVATQRAGIAADTKNPRIALEFDENGWFVSCQGNGETSVTLEKFQPGAGAAAVVLPPALWELVLTHASEVAPVNDLWFRSRFEIDHNNAKQSFLLRGVMSGMNYGQEGETIPVEEAAKPAPESKKGKAKAPKAVKKGV